MHRSIIRPWRVALALLAGLLGSCEVVEEDDAAGGSPAPAAPPPAGVGADCDSARLALSEPTPQAVGSFCVGLGLLLDGDQLGCVPTSADVTQCVDNQTGLGYAVRWSGSVGTAFGQVAVGRVTQQSASTYYVELPNVKGQLEPAGQCTLTTTAAGPQARYCAYPR